jgi:hypothetical protein
VTHSLGPWQQLDNAAGYGPNYAAAVWGPKGPGYGLIAHCSPNGIANEQNIADAKLIAAAPDLLAALELLVEAVEIDCSIFTDQPMKTSRLGIAQEAIKKARGES